jgi:hypothetical protein
MRLLARLDTIAGWMNGYLAIVAIALGVIDLAVLVTQSATHNDWRDRGAASPAHATAAPAHTVPAHRPPIL